MKVIKRPKQFDALQYNGTNASQVADFVGEQPTIKGDIIRFETVRGEHDLNVGDWIIFDDDDMPCVMTDVNFQAEYQDARTV